MEVAEEKTKSLQQRFLVRVSLAGSGTRIYSEARGKDLFTAVDKVETNMTRQLEQRKGKLYGRGRNNVAKRVLPSEEVAPELPAREVVKVKRFVVKPMSVTEAADQMEVLGHDFFLFANADTEEVNLLYRRKDGNYGLIEPELG